jgi:hypothetical protein
MNYLKGVGKKVSNATNAVLGAAIGQFSNLQPIVDAIAKGKFGEINPIALALALKEQKYQYDALLKEIENAVMYQQKIDDYLKLIPKDDFEGCAKGHFDKTYAEFNTLLNTLKSTNKDNVLYKFKDNLNSLNDVVETYNESHNEQSYTDKLKEKGDKLFITSYPAWYRVELNSSINKVNMALDGLFLANDILLMAEKTKKQIKTSCELLRIDTSFKADPLVEVEPYTDDDGDVFYDSD